MQHALRRAGQIVRACDVNYKPDAATGARCAPARAGTAIRRAYGSVSARPTVHACVTEK
eukprot:gene34988-43145_t